MWQLEFIQNTDREGTGTLVARFSEGEPAVVLFTHQAERIDRSNAKAVKAFVAECKALKAQHEGKAKEKRDWLEKIEKQLNAKD